MFEYSDAFHIGLRIGLGSADDIPAMHRIRAVVRESWLGDSRRISEESYVFSRALVSRASSSAETLATRSSICLQHRLQPRRSCWRAFSRSSDFSSVRRKIFETVGKRSIALRLIPTTIKTFEELNLPPILGEFAARQQGFFLVVGPAGHGKSTTLASMIETINRDRLEHILTIEDPIEFLFTPNKAIIDQREVKIDTPDFHTALWGVFRQDVDVIMVGEMREPETVSVAVTAAETGHLVLSTLHTNTASQTIDRIIDSFPPNQQEQIRIQLSSSLIGIFSQRLVPRVKGGLIPAYELLINNNAVANLIREKRTHEINAVIETGSELGMIDFNRSLSELARKGEITPENAYRYSTNPKALERMI